MRRNTNKNESYDTNFSENLLGIYYRRRNKDGEWSGGPMYYLKDGLAWDLSDTFNGLMMIPNLIGVVTLLPLVLKIVKNYVDRKIAGRDVAPMLSYDEEIQKEMESKLEEA